MERGDCQSLFLGSRAPQGAPRRSVCPSLAELVTRGAFPYPRTTASAFPTSGCGFQEHSRVQHCMHRRVPERWPRTRDVGADGDSVLAPFLLPVCAFGTRWPRCGVATHGHRVPKAQTDRKCTATPRCSRKRIELIVGGVVYDIMPCAQQPGLVADQLNVPTPARLKWRDASSGPGCSC